MFEKVLVANRGEIAVRVLRACEELGVRTVAIYSDADAEAGHVRRADEAYRVGPAPAGESYLDADAIIEAARKAGAEAVHPGYGFLAENADFARQVQAAGLVWVGPPPAAMERLGEKTSARRHMLEADVPVVPGTTDAVDSPADVEAFAEEHGYPVAIKAEGGGGGRGMKVVEAGDDVAEAFEAASREGEAYFDNPAVYVERYLADPRHVEVQVLADEHGTVRHLGERDCSLQRRHQKVVEEAPSPALDDDLREALGEAARRGIQAAEYTNAGTVEFLLADDDFYFLEVNTRIQVEHTVTEELTGIDIVKWQLRVAAGEQLDFAQDDVVLDGHAIEYRINAENPADDFAPATGALETYDQPGGIGVRVDDAVRQGDAVGGEYDSLVAKLVVTGQDRREALARSERALGEYVVEGLHTTIPLHRLMLTDERFRAGTHTTTYLDEDVDPERIERAVERWGPTERLDGEAAGEATGARREFSVEVDGKRFDVSLAERGGEGQASSRDGPDRGRVGRGTDARPGGSGSESRSGSGTESRGPAAGGDDTPATPPGGEEITAGMQGTILSVAVTEGDVVEQGDVVCVLEAMKMENDVVADRGGTVSRVAIREGDSVDTGDTLVVLE